MPSVQTESSAARPVQNRMNARVMPENRTHTAARRVQRICRSHPESRSASPVSAHHDAPPARTLGILQATLEGIEKIDVFVTRIQQTLLQARAAGCSQARTRLAQHYETLCSGVDLCAHSAGHAGINLIDGKGQQQEIPFGRTTISRFVIIHTDLTAGSTGLNLPRAALFENVEDIAEAQKAVHAARRRLKWARSHIEQSLQVLRRT